MTKIETGNLIGNISHNRTSPNPDSNPGTKNLRAYHFLCEALGFQVIPTYMVGLVPTLREIAPGVEIIHVQNHPPDKTRNGIWIKPGTETAFQDAVKEHQREIIAALIRITKGKTYRVHGKDAIAEFVTSIVPNNGSKVRVPQTGVARAIGISLQRLHEIRDDIPEIQPLMTDKTHKAHEEQPNPKMVSIENLAHSLKVSPEAARAFLSSFQEQNTTDTPCFIVQSDNPLALDNHSKTIRASDIDTLQAEFNEWLTVERRMQYLTFNLMKRHPELYPSIHSICQKVWSCYSTRNVDIVIPVLQMGGIHVGDFEVRRKYHGKEETVHFHCICIEQTQDAIQVLTEKRVPIEAKLGKFQSKGIHLIQVAGPMSPDGPKTLVIPQRCDSKVTLSIGGIIATYFHIPRSDIAIGKLLPIMDTCPVVIFQDTRCQKKGKNVYPSTLIQTNDQVDFEKYLEENRRKFIAFIGESKKERKKQAKKLLS